MQTRSFLVGLAVCTLALAISNGESLASGQAQADPPAAADAVGRYQLITGQVDTVFLGQRLPMNALIKFDTATGMAWQLVYLERNGDLIATWTRVGE